MSATLERVHHMHETPVVKDVVFGKFRILNVPHVELAHPTPDGERIVRDILVDLKLSDIYDHMKATGERCLDYNQF